jgi:hypothetical protein
MEDQLAAMKGATRPWVVLDRITYDHGEGNLIKIFIRNVGGGPAFDISLAFDCGVSKPLLDEDSLAKSAANAIERTAQAHIVWWLSMGSTAERAGYESYAYQGLPEFENATLTTYCFGSITYSTGDGSTHETRFAMEHNPKAVTLKKKAGEPLPSKGSFMRSMPFDAGDFRAVGGGRLNYAT